MAGEELRELGEFPRPPPSEIVAEATRPAMVHEDLGDFTRPAQREAVAEELGEFTRAAPTEIVAQELGEFTRAAPTEIVHEEHQATRAVWFRRNTILFASIKKGTEVTKKIISNKTIMSFLLLISLVLYIFTTLLTLWFFWGFHRHKKNTPLLYGSCNMITAVMLVLMVAISIVQTTCHVINGGPLLPKGNYKRVTLVVLHMALTLVMQAATGATTGYQALLTEALGPKAAQSNYFKQEMVFSRMVSISSTIYGIVVLLMQILAEPKQEDVDNSSSDDVPAWTIPFRFFHCAFALAGSLTMLTSEHNAFAFRFLVKANIYTATLSFITFLATGYSHHFHPGFIQ